MTDKSSVDYWADWLVDAVATATQDRRFLQGDPGEDAIAIEAIRANGKKAMENLIRHRSLCDDCGKYPADPPSSLCSGCEAYQEHRH